ncbi:HNH endonuclease [Deinococcus ficus]|uniref:HNH nuclease domain-containing protein n=1 Tax=Deinococcus ficus TaxID=317577 RepID=A0A221SXJ8_9DEIO|nr:hypothetical protein DFI_10420 [Deinococcus ficus]
MAGKRWSEVELAAAVESYLTMLQLENTQTPYGKAAYNQKLRNGPLKDRSKGAVEHRMANISAVLRGMGYEYIDGYKPLGNVGSRVASTITKLFASHGLLPLPSENEQELQQRVDALQESGHLSLPPGQATPQQVQVGRLVFKRDPSVIAWVLQEAAGTCELCGLPAPFKNQKGEPYLEVHHVRRLADGGPDTVQNAVALCPNCHRRCHSGLDRTEAVKALYARLSRLVPSA